MIPVTDSSGETRRLLIVSREPGVLRPILSLAETNSWQIESAVSPWDAMERLQDSIAPHLLVLDLPRGDGDSLHVLRWLRRLRPDLAVIVICFPQDAGRKREAIRLGALEVLVRPFDDATVESMIRRHLAPLGTGEADVASEDLVEVGPDEFFVSAGPITQKLRTQAELLAEADVSVLILGEAGSGKDTIARLIHNLSVRSGFRFLKVNCADMPGDLLAAEIFGVAGSTSPGKLERAEKGTLFLDEITNLPLSLQDELMHVLRDKIFRRPGNNHDVPADARILAATSANLERSLAERKLREDLYYRLSAFTVQVPPLRQRRNEISVLLRHSMHRLARHYGLPPREYSASVLDACQRHSWPGNLKELEAFVKRYLVAGDQELDLAGLNLNIGSRDCETSPSGARRIPSSVSGPGISEDDQTNKSLKSLIRNVKCEAERNAIATALHKTGWNRKAAARLLKVSYRTLLYKIDQYQMSASESFLSPYPGDKFSLHGTAAKGNAKVS